MHCTRSLFSRTSVVTGAKLSTAIASTTRRPGHIIGIPFDTTRVHRDTAWMHRVAAWVHGCRWLSAAKC